MATTDEIVAYYVNLLILQYHQKPKAKGTIDAWVRPVVMDQLPLQVQDAFSIDTAVGAQLDVLGKYTGVTRVTRSFTGPLVLNDDDYRLLIRFAVIKNNSDASLRTIQNLVHDFFPDALRVFDYRNMHMSYFFDSAYGTVELAQALVREDLLPRPMGVGLGAFIYMPNVNSLFCMRDYNFPVAHGNGFNNYTDYQTDWPWLSYAYAIVE